MPCINGSKKRRGIRSAAFCCQAHVIASDSYLP
jgi:hypothetical protein